MKIPGDLVGISGKSCYNHIQELSNAKPFLSIQARHSPIAYRPACHFVALPPMLPAIIGLEQAGRMHAVCTAGAALPPYFSAH